MSAQHTSGPWVWVEGQKAIVKQWNNRTWPVATVSSADLGWHEDRACASREAGANACLIAAAPDLLAALRTLCSMRDMTADDLAAAWGAARAAIAKATTP